MPINVTMEFFGQIEKVPKNKQFDLKKNPIFSKYCKLTGRNVH